MDSSNDMPSVAEYLSGWYLSDSLLQADLTSLSLAPLRSPKAMVLEWSGSLLKADLTSLSVIPLRIPKAPKESNLLLPTPSGLNLGVELLFPLDPGGNCCSRFL